MRASDWLDRAVEKIRFAPDREAVRAELEAHLEDRRESLEARGLSAEEAENAAAEAMGDPAAVAEELARIHRPWWGWLWRATQLALAAILILSLFTLIPDTYYQVQRFFAQRDPAYVWSSQAGDVIFRQDSGQGRVVAEDWRPVGSKTLGNYRFSVPRVWLERWEYPSDREASGWIYRYDLILIFRADSWRFWEPPARNMFSAVAGSDSEGQIYSSDIDLADGALSVWCTDIKAGLFSTWYRVELDREKLAETPGWVEVSVGYGGDSIRVDLRNEVIS